MINVIENHQLIGKKCLPILGNFATGSVLNGHLSVEVHFFIIKWPLRHPVNPYTYSYGALMARCLINILPTTLIRMTQNITSHTTYNNFFVTQ